VIRSTDTLFDVFAAFWCKSAPSHEKTAKIANT
jgi:hypothetical protein